MSYRALWAADVHVGNTLPFARRINADGREACTDRLIDSLDVLDQMASYGEEHGLTDLWFIGDLLDRRLLDGATLKFAMEKIITLADRGFHFRMIPGNHEAQDAAASMYTLRMFEGVRPNIEVWDSTNRHEVDGIGFRGIPYKPDDVAREQVLRIRDEEAGHPTILLLHQSLVGGKVGSWINPDGLDMTDLEGFHTVLAGHFHTPQTVSLAPLRMYLGAPMQHNFGDRGEHRGFWDIAFSESGDSVRKLVHTTSPEFHSINWSEFADTSTPRPEFKRGDYIEVEVRGSRTALKALEPEVERYTKAMASTFGARLAKPRYTLEVERKTRAKVATESGKVMTWPEAVSGYVDACDVTGLSRARLEALAREALGESDGR